MKISEIDLAEALIVERSRIKELVDEWKEKAKRKGFSPYGQLARNVLIGDLNHSQRPQILEKIFGYKTRMLPERNHSLTRSTWEFFDSLGGTVSGRESYSDFWGELEIKISAGYIYRLPGLEYMIVNWARKKAPSEKLIRSILEVLHMTRPEGWPSNRVPALLIADQQDLRIAGPIAPANTVKFSRRVQYISSMAG